MAQQSIILQAPSHLQLRRTTGGIVDLMIRMAVVDIPSLTIDVCTEPQNSTRCRTTPKSIATSYTPPQIP